MIIHTLLEAQRAEFGMVRALILKGRKQGVHLYRRAVLLQGPACGNTGVPR